MRENSGGEHILTVSEVVTPKQRRAFFAFPMKLYATCPYYVPPLLVEEKEIFCREKNPAFKAGDAKLFLARRNSEVVGRIAAIRSDATNAYQGDQQSSFRLVRLR